MRATSEMNRRRRRRRLDEEMKPFRRAGRDRHATDGLLRAVRQALGVPVAEIAKKLGVVESVVFALEQNELKNTIRMKTLSRVAEAMECRVVYGIVPQHGQTLEGLATERAVRKVLEGRENREQDEAAAAQLSSVSSMASALRAGNPFAAGETGASEPNELEPQPALLALNYPHLGKVRESGRDSTALPGRG